MYLINNKKNECSGCTACQSICPKNAIKMVEDEEGFKYPKTNKDKCINCGACYKICPNVKKDETNKILEAYGAKHKNPEEQITSRSGGVFIALSDYILNNGGIVYGAQQIVKDCRTRKENEDIISVCHNRATTTEERNKFKGSKYVQSDMGTIINDINKDLKEGKIVLFSGTPCQVAGVKAVIPKKYQEKLYTCDIVCHGVPSNRVFQEFLKYMEKLSDKKIVEFRFRDKRYGWESHYETSFFDDGTELTTRYFRDLFYGHDNLRPSCHVCNYANTNRLGDVSIADFWGVDKIAPDFLDKNGVSLVIINNEKGKKWFESIKNKLDIIQCSIEDCIQNTYTLNQPTQKGENREQFWQDFKTKEFEYIIKKYTKDEEIPKKISN